METQVFRCLALYFLAVLFLLFASLTSGGDGGLCGLSGSFFGPSLARVLSNSKIDNLGSIRVLEKCGFTVTGSAKAFANGRGAEIEETCLVLTQYADLR